MTAQRILICLHDFSRGGTERIALGLAASWSEAGREVTILCGNLDGGLRGSAWRNPSRSSRSIRRCGAACFPAGGWAGRWAGACHC